MEYADRVEIATPEGVDLSVELGGLGTRFIGQLVDVAIKMAVIGALAVALFAIGDGVPVAIFAVCSFLVWFFYDVLFEVLGGGRTPGKRVAGVRVIGAGGEPVGFLASTIRNLVRIVDGPGTVYVAGMVAIVSSRRNQRLGDMAANTLVAREPARARGPTAQPPPPPRRGATADAQWDVSAIPTEELAAVRHYLDRRWELDAAARGRLAHQLAEGLRDTVAGVPDDVRGEDFLERLAAAKESRA